MLTVWPSLTLGAIRQNSDMSTSWVFDLQPGQNRDHWSARRWVLQIQNFAILFQGFLSRFEQANNPQACVPVSQRSSLFCNRCHKLTRDKPERFCAFKVRCQHIAVAITGEHAFAAFGIVVLRDPLVVDLDLLAVL